MSCLITLTYSQSIKLSFLKKKYINRRTSCGIYSLKLLVRTVICVANNVQFCSGVCGCASKLLLLLKGNAYAGLGVERSGFEAGLGDCLVFLRKTPYSYSASLHLE